MNISRSFVSLEKLDTGQGGDGREESFPALDFEVMKYVLRIKTILLVEVSDFVILLISRSHFFFFFPETLPGWQLLIRVQIHLNKWQGAFKMYLPGKTIRDDRVYRP